MREYTEQEYRDILGNAVLESSLVDKRMAQAYDKIRKEERGRKRKRRGKALAGLAAMAAAFVFMIVFCVANPALAAKLPIMGSFFKDVEEKVSYKGDYSNRSEKLIPEGTEESTETDSPYIKTDNGVTITVGEVYCNDMALYLGVQIQKDQPVSREFIENHTYVDETESISLVSTLIIDRSQADGNDIYICPYSIEGSFVDEYTFTGIIRVDALDFVEELTPGYEGEVSVENWDEHFKRIAIPDEFSCRLNIEEVFSEFFVEEKTEEVEGTWNFMLDVKKDTSGCLVKEINETDENGFGISKITKSPYEIYAEAILPEGESIADYFVAIRDAQGKPLEAQGNDAEVYSIYNRDVSKVTVYICDYETYMNECKAENWQNLPKKAVYAKEITFD